MKHKETYNHIPREIFQIFNKISLGMLILDYQERVILFSNNHFKELAQGFEKLIFDNIFNTLDLVKNTSLRNDIHIREHFIIGYSIYKASERYYMVFLGDISSKKIVFNATENREYYERLSLLIAEIAHEVGNPLTVVTTTLEVLSDNLDTWDIEKTEDYLKRATSEIYRLSEHLKQLKDFSVLNIVEKKPCSLNAIINKVFTFNRPIIEKNKISLEYDIAKSIVVLVDEDKMYHVLLNILLNSVEALTHNGRICVKVISVDEYLVKLEFKNNGPVIPEEIKNKIFLPFFTTKPAGSGIGLAVALKMMIQMGGVIRLADSQEEYNTVFILYIPVYERQILEMEKKKGTYL